MLEKKHAADLAALEAKLADAEARHEKQLSDLRSQLLAREKELQATLSDMQEHTRAQLVSQQQQYHREKQTREAELADADQQTQVKAAAEKKELEAKVAAKEDELRDTFSWLAEQREALAKKLTEGIESLAGGGPSKQDGSLTERSEAGAQTARSPGEKTKARVKPRMKSSIPISGTARGGDGSKKPQAHALSGAEGSKRKAAPGSSTCGRGPLTSSSSHGASRS